MTIIHIRPWSKSAEDHARHQAGFTLIELLIVVAVIAILAAIAYPSYTQYVQKARRTDAMSTLGNVASRLERCYTVTSDYTTKNGSDPCVASSITSDEGFYQISVSASAASYTLTAAPQGAQSSDSCGSFTLNHKGVRTPDACW